MATGYPITTAIRFLKENRIAFIPRFYAYEERGGTKVSSTELEIYEHAIIKTLVMKTDEGSMLIVLMHGDCEVSTKQLARVLGVKRVEPADEASAQRATGYQFGGTSPFGTRNALPIYIEETIFDLPKILINGGKRGFLVEIDPGELNKLPKTKKICVKIPS